MRGGASEGGARVFGQGGSARNYNYFEKNNTCQLFGYAWRGGPVEGCSSGEHIYKPPPGPPPPAPCACKRLNETVGRRNESNQNYGGGGSSGLPPSCGRNYDMHHSRFLNGTGSVLCEHSLSPLNLTSAQSATSGPRTVPLCH